jgi:hypothetical protein
MTCPLNTNQTNRGKEPKKGTAQAVMTPLELIVLMLSFLKLPAAKGADGAALAEAFSAPPAAAERFFSRFVPALAAPPTLPLL